MIIFIAELCKELKIKERSAECKKVKILNLSSPNLNK